MSLRTKSRKSQWGCWAVLFLAGLVAYAIGLHLIGSETGAWLILARQNVAAFAAVSFVFGWLAYELRWDGIKRSTEAMVKVEGQGEGPDSAKASTSAKATEDKTEDKTEEVIAKHREGRPPCRPRTRQSASLPFPHRGFAITSEDKTEGKKGNTSPSIVSPVVSSTETGEAEWREARQLPHSPLPTMVLDLQYLTLLKRSAELGYAPALAKLGDYALKQEALAEAYFWYYRAQKQGMRNLDVRIRGIRLGWQRAGCPSQQDWYMLQDRQARAIARALLDRDAGRNAKAAAEFLASVGFA